MSYTISPIGNDQFFDSNGNLLVGGKIFTYLAGTSTKVATYTDILGSANHTNPIVLNASGIPPSPIYLLAGASYKFVLAPADDTDPPSSPIYTWDNISTIDPTALLLEQWITGTTPTYISATSFSVAGDQVSTYQVGRRVKLQSTIGTFYGTIIASTFGVATTVSVVLDTGTLDATLNAGWYGVLTPIGSAVPNVYSTGNTITITGMDTRTNSSSTPLTISGQTTGSPAAGIGTDILLQAESADEVPSNVVQFGGAFSDVTAASEDSYFRVLLRVAGAVLTECWRFAAAAAFKAILTHTNTADRTYTFPDWDWDFISGTIFRAPTSCASGSTRSHEGVFSSASGNLSGIHFYSNFTLNNGHTLTVPAGKRKLAIIATGTITINGTINASGAGAPGASVTTFNQNGTDQPGGGSGSGGSGDSGGGVVIHGIYILGGGSAGSGGAGGAGTQLTGSDVPLLKDALLAMGGAAGSMLNGTGSAGGGSIILIAPTIILASTAVLNTSGQAGNVNGDGGGGAGNVYISARSFTDNGCTFTMTGGAAGGGAFPGGAGAAGVKQINIYS